MKDRSFDIARLFAGFLADNLTEEQQQVLEAWKSASPENLALFDKVCREKNIRELNRMAEQYDRTRAWQKIEKNFQPAKKKSLRRCMAWAAVLVLPLCVGYFLMYRETSGQGDSEQWTTAGLPGSSRAILTMADGSVVKLDGARNLEWREKDGTKICKDSARLTYRETGKALLQGQAMVYNKLEVPRRGEYSLLLSDGTVVYLNAMSSLHYPVRFTGDIREVELSGEAYFEVKKDLSRPFVVRTQGMRVQVLGTQFNISAYPEDAAVKTTLVEGSVQVVPEQGNRAIVLKPSWQAVFCKTSGALEAREVNVAEYIAWKNGKFDFRDWRLEDVMNYLSRWYDIEVFYQEEDLKDLRFGCYIDRYSEIGPILELLEKTGKIKVSMEGKLVSFTYK